MSNFCYMIFEHCYNAFRNTQKFCGVFTLIHSLFMFYLFLLFTHAAQTSLSSLRQPVLIILPQINSTERLFEAIQLESLLLLLQDELISCVR